MPTRVNIEDGWPGLIGLAAAEAEQRDRVPRVVVEDGRYPPESPFCAQVIAWSLIHKQRQLEYGWLNERAKAVAHGPDLVAMPPLWP